MKEFRIEKVILDRKIKNNPSVCKILERIGDVEVVSFCAEKKDLEKRLSFEEAKKTLFLTEFEGDFIKPCPGTGKGYLCCGYTVVNGQVGCPLDCSYCILQDYLGPSPCIFYVNYQKIKGEIDVILEKNKSEFLRIGSGELTDSLVLDPITEFSSFIFSSLKERKNLIFEFKTKTDKVEGILKLPFTRNIMVSWSLNPEKIIKEEERFTASLKERLQAASRLQERGFFVGFHFDPVIVYPGWEKDYEDVVEFLFSKVEPSRILWISLGALRFPPSLKKIIRKRFPRTKIVYEEMVLCPDGKFRYIKPLRIKIFKRLYSLIKERAPSVFCYLCMESPDVWEKVTGFSPSSNLDFKKIFDEYCRKKLEEV